MSADSPKRAARSQPAIVPPEPVIDRSIIDSVTGFINDVTLSNLPAVDPKEQVQWVRFERAADFSNPSFGNDCDPDAALSPPLLLVIGYGNGIQVWSLPLSGEATEVLAWRHGVVKCVKILPTPIGDYVDADADEKVDAYVHRRPLIAICEGSHMSANGPQFCVLNIVSLMHGDTVKSIKFKTPILEVAANHQSLVVTFAERIAVFDARTFEDRLTITTCYPSPSPISANPIALGQRWLAYAERKLMPFKRSAGGCDCDGVVSYTATMLNAAKTLGKGLRGLAEQAAAGLTGSSSSQYSSAAAAAQAQEAQQMNPGVITVLDIKNPIKDTSPSRSLTSDGDEDDPHVAHFIAHTEAIAAMTFDSSGMLLLTADKSGHDFHVFRISAHPFGSASAAVQHLFILHRGDTTAKVQDMVFSLDSRWCAVTTARGTTHVFPVSTYGGAATVRTHGSAEVVNRFSRFHRSAGLVSDSNAEAPTPTSPSADPYHNPRLPPFPKPCVVMPLSQLRQPLVLATGASSSLSATSSAVSTALSRQRTTSATDESANIFRACAVFGKPRHFLLQMTNMQRESQLGKQPNACESLFVMAGHGAIIQYDLHPKPVPFEQPKPCAKSAALFENAQIELLVEAKAQWRVLRKESSAEIQPPLSLDNPLLKATAYDDVSEPEDMSPADVQNRWLSQVEIVTSSGPHRRLWMGPQFMFKTYRLQGFRNSIEAHQHQIDQVSVEVDISGLADRPARSNPIQMPAGARGCGPVLIESGSAGSNDSHIHIYGEYVGIDCCENAPGENQLREDLADAMRESPRDSGHTSANQSASPSPHQSPRPAAVAKVVNPLGTVTTVTETSDAVSLEAHRFAQEYSSGAYLRENSDESRFRPYVTVIDARADEFCPEQDKHPEPVKRKLIVPVIDSATLTAERTQRSQASGSRTDARLSGMAATFEQMSLSNRGAGKSGADKKDAKKQQQQQQQPADKSRSGVDKMVSDKNVENLTKSARPTAAAMDVDDDNDDDGGGADNRTVGKENEANKAKKKGGKSAKPSEPATAECDALKAKPLTFDQLNELNTKQSLIEHVEQWDLKAPSASDSAAKPRSKKKAGNENVPSSKESSVEKELAGGDAAASSKKKKKGRKSDPPAAPPADDSKSDTNNAIAHVDRTQCAEIQESLLRPADTPALVVQRKCSLPENVDSSEPDEPVTAGRPGKKKKRASSEFIEIVPLATSVEITAAGDVIHLDPSDAESLSFKSSYDDTVGVIGAELADAAEQFTGYDDAAEEAESGPDTRSGDDKMTTSEEKTGDEDSDAAKTSATVDPDAAPSAEEADTGRQPIDPLPDANEPMAAEGAEPPAARPPSQKPQNTNANNKNKQKKSKKRR